MGTKQRRRNVRNYAGGIMTEEELKIRTNQKDYKLYQESIITYVKTQRIMIVGTVDEEENGKNSNTW